MNRIILFIALCLFSHSLNAKRMLFRRRLSTLKNLRPDVTKKAKITGIDLNNNLVIRENNDFVQKLSGYKSASFNDSDGLYWLVATNGEVVTVNQQFADLKKVGNTNMNIEQLKACGNGAVFMYDKQNNLKSVKSERKVIKKGRGRRARISYGPSEYVWTSYAAPKVKSVTCNEKWVVVLDMEGTIHYKQNRDDQKTFKKIP